VQLTYTNPIGALLQLTAIRRSPKSPPPPLATQHNAATVPRETSMHAHCTGALVQVIGLEIPHRITKDSNSPDDHRQSDVASHTSSVQFTVVADQTYGVTQSPPTHSA
jgi:hypothetical protein